ncbi:MAG: hypothetical protein A2Y73_03625 [Chloroflexi bacterium RBG_13_56_8]|nr:MAG: hypothetical protein A2Y73_03625 [Chloroflexi bacterium RBG_13_56_8]
MIQEHLVKGWWHRFAPGVAYFAAWLLLSAAAFGVLLQWRGLLSALLLFAGVAPRVLRPLDRLGFILLGIVWIIVVGVLEEYFRKGLVEGQLKGRIARVALVEIGALGLYQILAYSTRWL